MNAKDSSKATRYVAQLYEARCSGQKAKITELSRKVEKHAPERKCLVLAARAGVLLDQDAYQGGPKQADKEYKDKLSSALEHENRQQGDGLDAAAHLAAIDMAVGRDGATLAWIPDPLHDAIQPKGGSGEESWATVCIVMGTLVRGLALEARGDFAAATSTYRSIIAFLSLLLSEPDQCAELLRWTEELLCHMCLYFYAEAQAKSSELGVAMATFHLLSKFLYIIPSASLGSRGTFTKHPVRRVWRTYYEALSRVVQDDLVYHPSPVHRDHDKLEHRGLLEDDEFFASRVQQRSDLQKVESSYEQLLLKETQFPKANEANAEVKSWIDLVMNNWRTFCGPGWNDLELGPGGKNAVSRNTLDILYRAATKTFQSTQVLRHLFTVHGFLGEYDLCFGAFASYVEIMNKGKARAEKSGQAGLDLDDNGTALYVAAEAIRVACRYGSHTNFEQAFRTSSTLETWLSQLAPRVVDEKPDIAQHNGTVPELYDQDKRIQAISYRALGISHATWARAAYDPATRVELQSKAVQSLLRAVDEQDSDAYSTEALYALGLALAERRDIEGAFTAVKRALANPKEPSLLSSPDGVLPPPHQTQTHDQIAQTRKLLPVWHLLSLLLSALDDFDTALDVCDAAFEQVKNVSRDPPQAGGIELESQFLSVQNPPEKIKSAAFKTVVDSMDSLEKQTLLEIKMTQLALREILDDTEDAVNGCDELFSLYASLFGRIDNSAASKKEGAHQSPPKSARSTIRSMFGRPKSMRHTPHHEQHLPAANMPSDSVHPSRPGTTTTAAPTIQVTNEDGVEGPSNKKHHWRLSARPSGEDLQKKSGSLRKKPGVPAQGDALPSTTSTAYTSRRPSAEVDQPRVLVNSPQGESKDEKENPINGEQQPLNNSYTAVQQHLELASGGDQLLTDRPGKSVSHSVSPAVVVQETRLKQSLLIKIWLFIGGLYSRASMHDEAKQAVGEAQSLVSSLELHLSRVDSSLKNFQGQGWGRGKSVDDLWADVYTEHGHLMIAQAMPHDAMWNFEQALSHCPDHVQATTGLCSLLLDVYCQKIPAEKPMRTSLELLAASLNEHYTSDPRSSTLAEESPSSSATHNKSADQSPLYLYRLAARDRAYALLTSLSKLGSGWDDPEVWSVLARAYEESGQVEKAKEALWWTVELEDSKPVRHWRNVNPGGYVL